MTPGTPAILPELPAGARLNRLEFARWLVSANNPLTPRVVMNRQWAAFFGRGIVKTTEDFGYQGAPPTHPELLDWLAVEFRRQGWSLKKMHRLIVTSATYRQSSRVARKRWRRTRRTCCLPTPPASAWRRRCCATSALVASGLLSEKIGGPSVFPPQPASVSSEGAYGALNWTVSPGEDRYRRGLYTFSKRTAPYAMFTTFDAPTGEVCVARREVLNTPLQALTLLNDQVFVEAAQALGKTIAALPGSDADRLAALFRAVSPGRPHRGRARCCSRSTPTRDTALRGREPGRRQESRVQATATPTPAPPGQPPPAPCSTWTRRLPSGERRTEMTLTIELTPQEEARLARAARRKGVPPMQFVKELVIEHLPASSVLREPTGGHDCPVFAQWDAEDAELTDDEVIVAELDWNELKTRMNESRALTGEEPLF